MTDSAAPGESAPGGPGPDEPAPRSGSLRLTYVGHATVLIELDGVRILTDPWLRRRLGPLRRRGLVLSPADLGDVDAVLVSHPHPDHFDRASLRAISGSPSLVVPRGLGPAAGRTGLPAHELGVGDAIKFGGGVRVTATPARHSRWPLEGGVRPLGFLLEGSIGVYFAGDTAWFRAMTRLAGRVDVALLPVGRWGPPIGPERLTPETAVEAARTVGARIAVPVHWGTLYVPGFAGGRWGWGSLDAGEAFARAGERAPDIEVVVLQPGETRDVSL
jgi:L-ascorbate metabolism protein UlaG (beta-lactamase superfamily)